MTPFSPQEECYPETRFGGFSRVDGTVIFFTRVQALLHGARIVVDVGCGRGTRQEDVCAFRRELADLRSGDRTVIGFDVSAAGQNNPFIDVFHRIDERETWPLEDGSADAIVSDFVLEHLSEPRFFFAEVCRILRPGGYFCARTTNKWGYVAIVSRLLPRARHARVLSILQKSRKEEDIFPTFYRCNTISSIRGFLNSVRMESVVLPIESEPNYFTFSRALYRCSVFFHRIIPDRFKSTLLVFARKNLTDDQHVNR
jgi:SAM-dependent methyltransferase